MVENISIKVGFVCVVAIFCSIKSACGIMCYQCNSLFDPSCHNLRTNSTDSLHYKPCTEFVSFEQAAFCRKTYQKITVRDGIVRIIRSCGYVRGDRDCYSYRNEDHEEISCQCFDDGCNNASRKTLTIFSAVLCVVFSKISSNWLSLRM